MIHRIFSSLGTFKELNFHPGLNVILAQKESGASELQTRNRAGKTSIIEIVHFLTGAEAKKDSLFREDALNSFSFGMEVDISNATYIVQRSGSELDRLRITDVDTLGLRGIVSNSGWIDILGKNMFNLPSDSEQFTRKPTFRSLFAYFVRRQLSGGFANPEKQATMQQAGDHQVALMFLLGLDWKIASEWQKVRDKEKTLTELKKAVGLGTFGNLIGKAADLRTQLTVAENRLNKRKEEIANFQILPQYEDLEIEANALTMRLNLISNKNTIDIANLSDIETALQSELAPTLNALENIYAEVGVVLPDLAIKRFDEVQSFHESVLRNRRQYLEGELQVLIQRIEDREAERQRLDYRRVKILQILNSHGALDQFTRLQGETGRLEADVEFLRKRFEAAEQLEGTKNELEIVRNQLMLRLRRDFTEQKTKLDEAILAFENCSTRLYEAAGSMTVEPTSNGPLFQFPMQGARSKGIKNMQIFCFDMMLMQLCAKRGFGPGFLTHDSHLFDGVDGRQIISALKVGAELAEELGFQYIVTLNEDDAYKEKIEGFDVQNYILPVELTDAKEDGGLFGIRF